MPVECAAHPEKNVIPSEARDLLFEARVQIPRRFAPRNDSLSKFPGAIAAPDGWI
jgi:hypothetical protein